MSVLEKAERALNFLRAADTSKGYDVQTATGTLGRCLGALGGRPSYTRHYAGLLPAAVPTLLALASHDSAEVRLAGEEALNRTVVGGYPFHAYKINITLQNQLDHTKNARMCIQNPDVFRWNRAALSRVCLGDIWLRPGVGKIRAQAQLLFPRLVLIVRTAEHSLQLVMETLEGNLPRILAALADYTTDEEIFDLAHEILQHVESDEPAVRRSAAACAAVLCRYRLPLVGRLLDAVVEKLWPEAETGSVVNGWFGVVKSLLQVNSVTSLIEGEVFTVNDFMELYQLCVHYLESTDVDHNGHNVVMECLAALATQARGGCRRALLEPRPTFVRVGRQRRHRAQYKSSAPLSMPIASPDEPPSELGDQLSFSGALLLGSLSRLQTPRRSLEDLTCKTPDSPTSEVNFELSTSEQLSRQLAEQLEGVGEEARPDTADEELVPRDDIMKINIGTVHDDDIPLKYCARLLASKFLLTGSEGGIIPDRNVRVSVKASALHCLSAILQMYPQALTLYLDKDVDATGHNASGSSEGVESSQDHTNDFVLERNVCYQDSLTDSFGQELLNKSTDSYSHMTPQSVSAQLASKREMYKSTGADSIDQKSSNKDVASNILDSKNLSGVKNELLTSADSTNPNMTISNFTSNSNMTGSNDPGSTEYPLTSSGDVLSSSIDLDMKFDHFGESTSNIENFDALNLTRPPREMRKNNTSDDVEEDTAHKRPLRRTDEVCSKDCPEGSKLTEGETVDKEGLDESIDNLNEKGDFENQHMSDIFVMLEAHSDPQIRGLVRVAMSSYLHCVLDLSHGDYVRWRQFVMLPKDIGDRIAVANLVDIMVKGLSDEVHTCVNHSLTALSKILVPLAKSVHSTLMPVILNALVDVETNSYWLCKVNLCKLYEKLPYGRLSLVCPGYNSRSSLIMEVLFRLLADQDQKVRNAASCAIAEIVPKIQPSKRKSPNDTLIDMAKRQTDRFNFDNKELSLNLLKYLYFQSDLPESLRDVQLKTCSDNLGFVVSEYVTRYMESSCKFNSQGLLEGLLALCQRWQPWRHPAAYRHRGVAALCLHTVDSCGHGVPACGSLLALSTLLYPLEVWDAMHQKPTDIFEKDSEVSREKWQHLQSEKCCQLAEKFLQITLKMLNILVHLIEEINPNVHLNKTGIALPGSPVRRKTQDSLPRRGSGESEADDKGSTKKKPPPGGAGHARASFVGQFVSEPFYMKLHDNLRAAYSNHKITLDPASSMFYTFMSHVLDALAVQLELSTEKEFGPVTEEILYYLKVILPLRADKTVFCVTQLLKCLFGTNMVNQYSDYISLTPLPPDAEKSKLKFFEDIIMVNSFQTGLKSERNDVKGVKSDLSRQSSVSSNMSQKTQKSVDGKNPRVTRERELLERMESFARNRSDRKWNTNKKELERYIRLLEPLVIQALKSYTMHNHIPLQCKVLGLLNQLLTLRVNYCMLDSDQVFIGFLLRQLDLVEQNEIPDCSELVNSIMTFLVLLASSKHHTKQLMDIPKLIQLCDGLSASGRRDECASALRPLAARVFWSCRQHGAAAPLAQEAAVTREVLAYMLQRSMSSPKVLDMVSCMLCLSKEPEDYRRRSEQAADAVLALLSQRAAELNSRAAIGSLERLLDTICREVLLEQARVETVLKILFAQPPDQNTSTMEVKERYLATIMVFLRKILVNIPESEIVLTIDYLKATFISPSSIFFSVKTEIDPLNVQNVNENCANLSPDVIMVRFLFKTLTYVVLEIEKCDDLECADLEEDSDSGEHKLLHAIAVNIICQIKHILHLTSGCQFPLIAKTAQSVLHNEQSGLNTGLYSPEENIPLERLNHICVRRSYRAPLLTVHWSHLLLRTRFLEQKYWQSLLGYMRSSPLAPENGSRGPQMGLLQIGCFMAYCEYFVENGLTDAIHLTWLLVNRVHVLVSFYPESVVRALVDRLHENGSASGLLLQAVAARCQSCIKDEFALNAYRTLSGCHESQSGALLFLACRVLGRLEPAAGARFARLAARRCRALRALAPAQIAAQLAKEDVQVALELLQRDRVHLRYASLVLELNALATTVFDLSPLDMSQDRSINPQYIITTNVDSSWLVNQIKSRCCVAPNESDRGLERLQDFASLLANLSTEELTPILSCPEFDRRILHSCFILSCDNYIKEFLKVLSLYETREAEKDNTRRKRAEQKAKEETTTSNIDSNIMSVANSLTRFRKSSESDGSKSQFFISITENKDQTDDNFGNLQISEDEPNDMVVPELPGLFATSLAALEKSMSGIIRLFPKQNRPLSQSENFNLTLEQTIDRYTRRCHQVFQDKLFYQEFCIVQGVISGYLEALKRIFDFSGQLDCDISDKVVESVLPSSVGRSLAILTVISLQYLSFLIKNKKIVESATHNDVSFRDSVSIEKIVVDDVVAITLRNASAAYSFQEIWSELNVESNSNRIQSAISCLYAIVKYGVKDTKPIALKKYVRSDEDKTASDICLTSDKLLTLIEYWENTFYSPAGRRCGLVIGEHYRKPIEMLIVAFSRLDLVCNIALIPPLAWPAVDLGGKRQHLQKIDLPLQALQDMDVLEGFLFRVNLMGRWSKKVWEEIWMCLLAALQGNGTHWAVHGVMQLLLSIRPPALHCPRDYLDDGDGMHRLRGIVVGMPIYSKLFEQVNLERVPFLSDEPGAYSYGQFNTEYLRLASDISEEASFRVRICLKRVRRSTEIDVNSCLQLLMDVITQMLEPKAPTGVSARSALVSCAVNASELFTAVGQWYWLASLLISLTGAEHERVTQYSVVSRHLLYGLCKSLTVLEGLQGRAEFTSVYQKLAKWLTSPYAPLRQCALHGCLLQLGSSQQSSPPYKRLVAQLSDTARQYLSPNYRISLYEQSLFWAVLFKLVSLGYTDLMHTAVEFLLTSPDHPCADLVVKGITSMIRISVLPKDLKKSIMEKLLNGRDNYSEHHYVQVLMVHLFSADNKLLSPRLTTDVSNMDPDILMTSMERITLLYKVLRESTRAGTASVGAAALRYCLRETLPPAATLSRVVIEFLECCRETERHEPAALSDRARWMLRAVLNAEVVFEVFETAVAQSQLPVLSGWIFEALCHLLAGKVTEPLLPYCLLCLLLSASANPHLRRLAPLASHTLRRGFSARAPGGRRNFGACDRMSFADRRLLCLVALHSEFSKVQLEKLRELCGDCEMFEDLLKCLLSA